MNNLLTSIRNWNSKWINLIAFGFVVLGNFIDHIGYFIGLVSVVFVVSIIRFFHDRKWLKDAEKYIRMTEKLPLWRRIIGIVWTVGLLLLILETDFISRAGEYVSDKTLTTFVCVSLILALSDYYQKFVNSVKSFEDGIQLPGRNQELIPWKEVYEFNFSQEEKITISSSKGEQEFIIHKDDPEQVNGMISDWNQRNGKRR